MAEAFVAASKAVCNAVNSGKGTSGAGKSGLPDIPLMIPAVNTFSAGSEWRLNLNETLKFLMPSSKAKRIPAAERH
jgi:hypothetical protein